MTGILKSATAASALAVALALSPALHAQTQGGGNAAQGSGNAGQQEPMQNCANLQPGSSEAEECEARLRSSPTTQSQGLTGQQTTQPGAQGQPAGGARGGQGGGQAGGGTAGGGEAGSN